jgi:hypothetical protein
MSILVCSHVMSDSGTQLRAQQLAQFARHFGRAPSVSPEFGALKRIYLSSGGLPTKMRDRFINVTAAA